MIKAFIFDVGGTLVKTDKAILEALRRALQGQDIIFQNEQDVINVFGQGQLKNVETAVKGSYADKDVDEKIKLCFKSFQTIFPSQVMHHFIVIDKVLSGLQQLHKSGMKLAVLTGFDRRETLFFLEKMGLQQYFDLVLSAEDILKHRPDPRGLVLVLEKLRMNPEEVIYVGDAVVDIQFARNAGVKVVCVKTGAQDNNLLEKEQPDYLANNFKEMVEQVMDHT